VGVVWNDVHSHSACWRTCFRFRRSLLMISAAIFWRPVHLTISSFDDEIKQFPNVSQSLELQQNVTADTIGFGHMKRTQKCAIPDPVLGPDYPKPPHRWKNQDPIHGRSQLFVGGRQKGTVGRPEPTQVWVSPLQYPASKDYRRDEVASPPRTFVFLWTPSPLPLLISIPSTLKHKTANWI